jgi:glutathione S-transferase
MVRVFGSLDSGNCYKVQLVLEQLAISYQWQDTSVLDGATRTAEFLAINPNGRVPVAEVEPGRYLPESNAILCYFAEGTPLWPAEKFARAQALQWLFFEQYSHEPYIAVARFISKFLPLDHARRADLPRLRERGHEALRVMEQHLERQPFFAGENYSIADIALFAYTHVAADGGFDLQPYPAIGRWFERVRAQPRFVAMP